MKKLTVVVRVLLGLLFLFSGIAFFFTTPPPMEGAIGDFFKGLAATGYFFYLLKGTEILCGIALVFGVYVPLALVVLAPIILNIFLVHALLMPQGLILAVLLVVAEVYLAFFSQAYRPAIKQLFKKR